MRRRGLLGLRSSGLLVLAVASLAPIARAGTPTPEEIGKAQAAEDKALADVDAAHGNKKESELSTAERRQIIAEKQKASRDALEKAGVNPKDYARAQATLHGDDKRKASAAAQAEKDRQASAGAPPKSAADSKGPIITYDDQDQKDGTLKSSIHASHKKGGHRSR